jgi:hypothetical protein
MNLQEFINELFFISDEHIKTKQFKTSQFILALNKEKNLYFIDVETCSGTYPVASKINGKEYYLSRLENFIKEVLNNDKCIGKLQLPFNITESLSQNINIYMQPCFKSQKFIYLNTETEKIHQKNYDTKWKEKILYLLGNCEYLSLSDIINLTRGIRNSNIRKQYLRELVDENKLEIFEDGNHSRRPKTYYKIKQNENITSDNSGESNSEAAGAEGSIR